MKKFFVTGTNTDIGKTFISSILFNFLGENTCYYKPVQTGCTYKHDKILIPDLDFVKSNSKTNDDSYFKCSYPLKYSLSPHLSFKKLNSKIDIKKIIKDYKNLELCFKNIIVEGAGGVFTPLSEEKYFIYNLVHQLKLNTILVTSTNIGTINHTILTINHLLNNDINLSGIVFNKFTNKEYEIDNINFIKNYSGIQNILIIPKLYENKKLDTKKINNFINNI